jgi:uncharacterized tellurite resistance protein B-like protein
MTGTTSIDDLLNTQQKKLAFFQNLILVAVADGYIDKRESDFLVTVGRQLNLTEEDTRPIADNFSLLSFIIPEDGLQKTMELQTLVMMVVQDGKVADAEYNLCLEYARRIGYSKDMLDDFLNQLQQQ